MLNNKSYDEKEKLRVKFFKSLSPLEEERKLNCHRKHPFCPLKKKKKFEKKIKPYTLWLKGKILTTKYFFSLEILCKKNN
jgi:hypothetical protein